MELADRAGGGDHDIERTVPDGGILGQPPRTVGELGRGDRHAAVQRDPRLGARGGEERFEQHAAVKAQGMQLGIEVGVAQVDDSAAIRAATQKAVDARRPFRDLMEQPEPRQHRLPRGLQRDAGTDRARHRDAFEQRNRMTGASEQDCSAGARRTGSDHGDAVRSHPATISRSEWADGSSPPQRRREAFGHPEY